MRGVGGDTNLCGSGADENIGSCIMFDLTGAGVLKKTEEVVEGGTL